MRMWEKWITHTLLVRMKNGRTTLENSLAIYLKTKHVITTQASNYILGFYLREMKTLVHTKIYTQMFIAILFIITNN